MYVKKYDLIYVHPKKHNPTHAQHIHDNGYNRYLYKSIGALNKAVSLGLEVRGYIEDIFDNIIEFTKLIPSKCYVIDINNILCLRNAIKLCNYLHSYHECRIFAVCPDAQWSNNLYTLLSEHFDMVLFDFIEERLPFLCTREIPSADKLYPQSQNKLELGTYDYVTLDMFNDKQSVKRTLNPYHIEFDRPSIDPNNVITPISETTCISILSRLASAKFKSIFSNTVNVESAYTTPLSLITNVTDVAKVTKYSAIFKDVLVTQTVIAKSDECYAIRDNVDMYRELNALTNVRLLINIIDEVHSPSGITTIDIDDMTSFIDGTKNKRKKVSIASVNTVSALRGDDIDTYALMKRFD